MKSTMSSGSASRIVTVARKELVDTIRDRRTILVTLISAALAGPIFLLLMFNMFASQADRTRELKLAVQGAERAAALIAYLERQQVKISPAPDDFEKQIRSGDLDVVMIVEPKFEEDAGKGRAATVRLVYDRSRDRARASIEQAETLLRAYNRQWGQTRLLLRGIAPEVGNPLNVETVNLATPQQSGAIVLFLLAYYGLFSAVMGGMAVALDTTAGERERTSLEPLLMTPARPFELVGGKWIAIALFNAFVVLVTLGAFWATLAFAPLPPVGIPFLFGATEFWRFIVVLLPIIALVPAVLLWIGTRGRTYKEAQANVSVLMIVVAIVPFFQLFLRQREPDWIALVPISGQYSLLNRVLRGEGIPLPELAMSWMVPIGLIVFALFAVARLWSRESMLVGK